MTTYKTTGGPRGGEDVELKPGTTAVDLPWTSEQGRAWELHYELREHDPETGAMALIFVGRSPA